MKPHTKERNKRVRHQINGWICSNGILKFLGTTLRIQVWSKHPLDQEGQTVKLVILKKRCMRGNPCNCVIYFSCVFIFVGIKLNLHNKENTHLLPYDMCQQMMIKSEVKHKSGAIESKSFTIVSTKKYWEFYLSLLFYYLH